MQVQAKNIHNTVCMLKQEVIFSLFDSQSIIHKRVLFTFKKIMFIQWLYIMGHNTAAPTITVHNVNYAVYQII